MLQWIYYKSHFPPRDNINYLISLEFAYYELHLPTLSSSSSSSLLSPSITSTNSSVLPNSTRIDVETSRAGTAYTLLYLIQNLVQNNTLLVYKPLFHHPSKGAQNLKNMRAAPTTNTNTYLSLHIQRNTPPPSSLKYHMKRNEILTSHTNPTTF